MQQIIKTSKESDYPFQEVYLYPDDNFLVFVEKNNNDLSQFQVINSISFKNIIQTDLVSTSGKYSIASSNTLEIRYVKNPEAYEKFVLAKWAKYKESIGQDIDEEPFQEPSNFIQVF